MQAVEALDQLPIGEVKILVRRVPRRHDQAPGQIRDEGQREQEPERNARRGSERCASLRAARGGLHSQSSTTWLSKLRR